MNSESILSTVARTQEHLDSLRGGLAKVWHFRYSYSQVVIRITMPDWTSRRAYFDCIACSRVSFVPSWEPVSLAITVREDHPSAPVLVEDGNRFRVECQSVQVEELDDDQRHACPPTSGLGASGELVDMIRESWMGIHVANPTFSCLWSFLRGYQEAMSTHRIAWNDDFLSLLEYQKWLKNRLECSNMSLDWAGAIKLRYNDDEEAYRQFFNLWQEYRNQKNLQNMANTGQSQSPPAADQPAADE